MRDRRHAEPSPKLDGSTAVERHRQRHHARNNDRPTAVLTLVKAGAQRQPGSRGPSSRLRHRRRDDELHTSPPAQGFKRRRPARRATCRRQPGQWLSSSDRSCPQASGSIVTLTRAAWRPPIPSALGSTTRFAHFRGSIQAARRRRPSSWPTSASPGDPALPPTTNSALTGGRATAANGRIAAFDGTANAFLFAGTTPPPPGAFEVEARLRVVQVQRVRNLAHEPDRRRHRRASSGTCRWGRSWC